MSYLVFWAISAFICKWIADSNGRNKWLAFFLWFCFWIFAIIGYVIDYFVYPLSKRDEKNI